MLTHSAEYRAALVGQGRGWGWRWRMSARGFKGPKRFSAGGWTSPGGDRHPWRGTLNRGPLQHVAPTLQGLKRQIYATGLDLCPIRYKNPRGTYCTTPCKTLTGRQRNTNISSISSSFPHSNYIVRSVTDWSSFLSKDPNSMAIFSLPRHPPSNSFDLPPFLLLHLGLGPELSCKFPHQF
jgi:hypothetical protein